MPETAARFIRKLIEAEDATLAANVQRAHLRNFPVTNDGAWHTVLQRPDAGAGVPTLSPGHILRYAVAALTNSVDQTGLRFRLTIDDAAEPQLGGLNGFPAQWQSPGGISPQFFDLPRFGVFPATMSGNQIFGGMAGAFVPLEELIQENTGARCVYLTGYQPAEVAYVSTSPAPNATDAWIGQQTGTVFTPTTAPTLGVNTWGVYHRIPMPYSTAWKLEVLNAKSASINLWVDIDYAATHSPAKAHLPGEQMRLFARLRTNRITVYEESDLIKVTAEAAALVGGTYELTNFDFNGAQGSLEGNVAIYYNGATTSDNRGTAIDDSLDDFWSDHNQGRNMSKTESFGRLMDNLNNDGVYSIYKFWDRDCFPHGESGLRVTMTNGDSGIATATVDIDVKSTLFYYADRTHTPTASTPLIVLNVVAVEAADRPIAWDASPDDIRGYNVYRNGTKINPSLIPYNQAPDATWYDNYGETKLVFTDTGRGTSAKDSYTVRAVNWNGDEGPDSNSAVAYWRPSDIAVQGFLWYRFKDTSKLWQDAARTIPALLNNQNVKGVTDDTGSGNHASYPSGTHPPHVSLDSGVTGGGSGTDGMVIPALSGNVWTIFGVCDSSVNVTADFGPPILGLSTSATNSQLNNLGRAVTAVTSGGATARSPLVGKQSRYNYKSFGFVLNGGNALNGNAAHSLVAYEQSEASDPVTTTDAFTADRLFTRSGLPLNVTQGRIFVELYAVATALTAADRKLLDGYLRSSNRI